MKFRAVIRHRLMAVVLLGVLTSALSLVALVRALSSFSLSLRIERGRTGLTEELERLSRLPPSAGALGAGSVAFVGMRGGWVGGAGEVAALADVPSEWRPLLADTVAESVAGHRRVIHESELGEGTLLLAAMPDEHGGLTWTGYSVNPSPYLRPWRIIATVLSIATVLLVFTAVWGAFSLRRSTSALHAALIGLGKDLTTPVPPPDVAELTGVADGIRRMAADLLASREATDRLMRELAQKERLAALGRVAAGIAHEVRNPLASIKLRLDLTAAAQTLSPQARQGIESASQEIARLDRLVGDLLLVAGKKLGPRREVDLGALVRSRVEAMAPWAHARGVTLQPAGEGGGTVDPESIARAVDNLLRNAVEATPAGGAVTARLCADQGAVELLVEDPGSGVPAARAAELFEPFFTTKAEGTGLGLAISRAIAREHGGDLTYSREGERTRFSLRLPLTIAGSSREAA